MRTRRRVPVLPRRVTAGRVDQPARESAMKRSWAATILAFVMALIGIILTLGGAWLLLLGGSPYYLIAGILMLASGWFLLNGRMLGGWIYIALFLLSAVWGFDESRGNPWA